MTFSRASIALFLLLISFSCQEEKKVYHDLGLKGSVKSVKERHYEAIEKFGEVNAGKRRHMGRDLLYKMEYKNPTGLFFLQEYEFFLNPYYATVEVQKSKILEIIGGKEYDIYFDKNKNINRLSIYNSFEKIENDIMFNLNNNITEISAYKNDKLEAKIKFKYSEDSKIPSREFYDENGGIINIQKVHSADSLIAKSYSKDGELISKTSMFFNSSDNPQKYLVQYYDNNGKDVATEKCEYFYDKNKNLIKNVKTIKKKNGEDIYKSNFNYDHDDFLIDCHITSVKNEGDKQYFLEVFYNYIYEDELLKIIDCKLITKNDGKITEEIKFKYFYTYDENNFLLEKKLFQDDKLKGKAICEYTLDENNNWIECIYSMGKKDKLPKATYVLKRDIEYY